MCKSPNGIWMLLNPRLGDKQEPEVMNPKYLQW